MRGLYSRQMVETRGGWLPRQIREEFPRSDSRLKDLLARETGVSMRGFVGLYLPMLDLHRNVREPLKRGEMTDEELAESMSAVDQMMMMRFQKMG